MIYVAYNAYGDLIAEADSYDDLVEEVEWLGYDLDLIQIGKVTP